MSVQPYNKHLGKFVMMYWEYRHFRARAVAFERGFFLPVRGSTLLLEHHGGSYGRPRSPQIQFGSLVDAAADAVL